MLRLVLRGFAQRKVRVALTAIAIVLGVALMAGTYILTDTINNSFAKIFQTASKGHDVVVTPAEQLGREIRSENSPVTQAMVEKVQRTPGVAEAAGSIFSRGTFLNTHRKRLTSGFAPAFINSIVPPRFESFKPVHGTFPVNASQVAIDEATAQRAGLHIGDQMIVAGTAATGRYTISGILRFGGGESFGGAGVATLLPVEAQRLLGNPGHFDQIDVAARPGVTPGQLRDRIRAELPRTVEVRTGSEQAEHDTGNLEHNLGGLRTFLLIFAYVALVVGAFIIFNTFSITVAQRTREFGLLRTLGASRGQILRSVVYEGLMLGAIGAGLGLLAGIGVAPLLDALFKAFGATLPDNGTVIETRTVIVSLLVGIIVTVLAGLPPALRATRVPPVAAMREGVPIPPRPLPTRKALIIRFVIGVLILAVLISIGAAGIGIVLIVIWVLRGARLAVRLRRGEERPQRRYRIVPALGHAIGRLVRWRGITGRLAEENSIRQPGRTLVTAATLTVGLGLCAFVAVLAASFKATINHAVDRSFAGNLIVENSQSGGEQGIPPGVAVAVRKVPGVKEVTAVAFTLGRPVGSKHNEAVTAVEPASFGNAYRLEYKEGPRDALASLSGTSTIVTEKFAKSQHLKPGRTITLLTPTGAHVTLTTIAVIKENAELLGGVTIDRPLAATAFGQREDGVNFVTYVPGATDKQVQPAVNRVLAESYPQVRSRTAAQFKQDLAGQINNLLTLIYVLLALSVIVSLFGIVNTLILSIYERSRELGMMRAIGTSRRQVRQMIRYESVITALIGGVFGLVLGILGALATSIALSGEGYVQAWPVGTLIVLLLASAVVGVIAAAIPARRAARLNMLQAISSE
ncbi:MAG TPA: FtsX-like permease family protein [Solirubrobacteraceae bacterium]|jgi:putative ABC transport system permease protein|nr:FtsX-like permease family protein [Solirubrobacteraceae bacterium]